MSEEKLLPREKMQKRGVESLKNEELLALILGSGCPSCDVFQFSRNLSEYLASVNKFPLPNVRLHMTEDSVGYSQKLARLTNIVKNLCSMQK